MKMKRTRPSDPRKDFTLEHYREILKAIRKSHRTLSFKDASALGRGILEQGPFVLMRHDVEISLSAAVELARVDHSEGISSTFFLLVTGDYNIFEAEGADAVSEILGLGHDIGLHYDGALLKQLGLDPKRTAKLQIAMMEDFFSTTVYSLSSHMPMRSGVHFSIDDKVDTYDPLYVDEIKYLSDSTQSWREGVVSEILHEYPNIHLLTHEYYWTSEGYRWDLLLLMEAERKFHTLWDRAKDNIALFEEGLRLRKERDKEFRTRIDKGS